MSLKSGTQCEKYMDNGGRKNNSNTCITALSLTPEIQVSAIAYLVWVTLLGVSMYM